jgi:pyruvate/2-oxoglutarate dehydrogenase complex dihydrolipoamide acyltransferase (E2) component
MAYDRVLIRDLGSRNGVRVNGRLVEEIRLHPGDELAIGPVLFRLEAENEEPGNSGAMISRPSQPPKAARPVGAPANVQAAALPPRARSDSEIDLVPLDDF